MICPGIALLKPESRHRTVVMFCFIIAVLIQSESFLARVCAADSDIDKFLGEYGKAAIQIENHYARVRGNCKITRQMNLNSKKILTDDATFNNDHGFKKVSILRALNPGEKGDRHEFVYCVAPDSSFTIIRRAGEKSFDGRGISSDGSDSVSYNNKFGKFLSAPFSLFDHTLLEYIESNKFKIVTAEQVKPNQFELEYLIGSSINKDRIKLVLDPSRGWVITSGEIIPASLGGRTKIEFQVEYQADGPIPLPKRVKYREPTGLESTCEFTSITTEPTNSNEFTMTFYGLPEMRRSGRYSSGIPVLFGLAMLGAIIGVGLRIRSRHSKQPLDSVER